MVHKVKSIMVNSNPLLLKALDNELQSKVVLRDIVIVDDYSYASIRYSDNYII